MLFRSLLLLSLWLLISAPVHAQLSVDTLLTIGDDESAEAEYLFGTPDRLVRAPTGLLFVSDQQLQHIRVYDAQGAFVRKLGQRGEGPGEFERPTVLLVSENRKLLVRDERHHRVTIFDANSLELVDTLPFGYFHGVPTELAAGDWGGNMRLLEAPDGTFVMLTIGSDGHPESEGGREKLFIRVARDFSEVVEQFGAYDLVPIPGEFVRRVVSTNPGNALCTTSGNIWYAPAAYEGELLRFEFENDTWSAAQAVTGMSTSGPVYETVDPDEADHQHIVSVSTRGPRLAGRLLRTTAGLVEAPDGDVLHFSYHIRNDNRAALLVERFTPEGLLVGVYSMAEHLPPSGRPGVEVHAVDEDGHLYTIDRTGDAPVIRVLSVGWPE